MGAHKS